MKRENKAQNFLLFLVFFLIGLQPEQFQFYQLEINTGKEIYEEEDKKKYK